ncbi:MAG: response regulator [Chloroflexi bacterium]|nr:response regulator [Chloroflexota bacterium]
MEELPRHPQNPQVTPPTVLVVDDEPAIREVVACMLEDEGYAVRQATDGLEALQEMEAEEIDLVLSDVKMPGLDGAGLVQGLRRRRLAVPVVLMSAVSTGVDLPGVPFLPKPFESERLLSTVAAAIAANGRSARSGSSAWSAPR